jgi:hypothetical protein
MAGLIKYDAMCRAIEAAHKVDEVKDIRDKAAALEHYARQATNTDAERQACQIRLRAERKAGQLLAQTIRKGGDKKSKSADTTSILKANGISKDQSSQWQKLGAMSQHQFDLAIGAATLPTTKGLVREAELDKARVEPVHADILWLCGRLLDFERKGLLAREPAAVMKLKATPGMLDDIHTLAPRVAAWLKRIGEMK